MPISLKLSAGLVALLPYAELCRNVGTLEGQYGIPVRGVVINAIIPESERETSDFWVRRCSMQRRFIDLAHRRFSDRTIGEVPLLPTESVGVTHLMTIGQYLYGKVAE